MDKKILIELDLESNKVEIKGGNGLENNSDMLLSVLNLLSRTLIGFIIKYAETGDSLKKDMETFKSNFVFILQNMKL